MLVAVRYIARATATALCAQTADGWSAKTALISAHLAESAMAASTWEARGCTVFTWGKIVLSPARPKHLRRRSSFRCLFAGGSELPCENGAVGLTKGDSITSRGNEEGGYAHSRKPAQATLRSGRGRGQTSAVETTITARRRGQLPAASLAPRERGSACAPPLAPALAEVGGRESEKATAADSPKSGCCR